jgi:translation initiation factor 1
MMKSKGGAGGLVYSTEHGRTCPGCRMPVAQCVCRQQAGALVPKADAVVRVFRETKGRGGKCVTVIKGVPLEALALATLAKSLKTSCGTGGTVKDGVIEIQGDHADLIVDKLKPYGWVVKRSGG